jgi:hypothetical protein
MQQTPVTKSFSLLPPFSDQVLLRLFKVTETVPHYDWTLRGNDQYVFFQLSPPYESPQKKYSPEWLRNREFLVFMKSGPCAEERTS